MFYEDDISIPRTPTREIFSPFILRSPTRENFYPYILRSPSYILRSPHYILRTPTQENRENQESLKEIKSNNDNFIQEKNIKYTLYPLYINWKKIETKSDNNVYYNIFKLFGYFGEAIFNILT